VRDSGAEASEPSDDDLLARARAGDRPAFGAFFRHNHDRVGAFFYRRTFCPATTADLTSETFARALAGLGRFDPAAGTAVGWLFGIANHVNQEWVRKGVVNRRTADKLAIHAGPLRGDDLERVEDLADVASMRTNLVEALAQLSPSLRDAVVLRVARDLSYEQVADQLGCTPGAARVRVTRGLAQLSALMEAS
jgi:RNA polymerase sigma-70 factor (ECF subfamily)